MQWYQQKVAECFARASQEPLEVVLPLVESPPQDDHGDRAVACFRFAKKHSQSPQALAEQWAQTIVENGLPSEIQKVKAQGAYINFYFNNASFLPAVLTSIVEGRDHFGKQPIDKKRRAVIEFSSANIAKPFSIGHLRSTNIGACLSRIYTFKGWSIQRINHLGDWGTQFGKLIVAYRRWGSADMLDEDPIQALFKLYVKFHEEEAQDATLTMEAREAFALLEKGDSDARELWQWFRDLSLKELDQLYTRLGVEFDHYWGESFYIDQLPDLMKDLQQKNLLQKSEGALIVDLKEQNKGVAILKKGDESSLYLTRDLAAAIYRFQTFDFEKMVYVVGSEQSLHFQQLFEILRLAGHSFADRCEHVPFGQITFGMEKMSTRKGNVVFLKDVLQKASETALEIVREKNPSLENASEVADQVGLGAILFADLSARRIKNVKFNWDEILSFEGDTGPYLQYTYVRTQSLITRYGQPIEAPTDWTLLDSPQEQKLVRTLAKLPMTLDKVIEENEPFYLAKYLIDTTHDFNRFYQACRILDEEASVAQARMYLVSATAQILSQGMQLLGIPTPTQM
jgi:arginyl-tRNA synthetase